jgi:asparagine synthase (glutamine-hydrolysing)
MSGTGVLMCGIVGSYRFDGGVLHPDLLRGGVRLLKHRGPDRQDQWMDGSAGLGHARLAIIDLSAAGDQPMHSSDGRYVIVYNGEIYNYVAIRRSLGDRCPRRGASDTEVLLNAYAAWGEHILPQLEGMFAFAIYDKVARTLLLARDPFGIKPLYYHRNKNRLVFASEIKPLWLDPETPRAPNYAALRRHVLFGYSVDPETAFIDILRLPPAHFMEVKPDGRCAIKPYWNLEQSLENGEGDLRQTLQESIGLHAVADVPVGILLSGGLDSSLMLALLSESGAIRQGFRAYNVGLDPSDPVDARAQKIERLGAERTCGRYGVPLAKIHPHSAVMASLEDIVRSVEEPIPNSANRMIDLICSSARSNGDRVLLSGHGGDEIFAGYRRHVWAHYLGRLGLSRFGVLGRLAGKVCHGTLVSRISASLQVRPGIHPLVSVAAYGWDLIEGQEICSDWFSPRDIPAAAAPLMSLLDRWRDKSFLKQMMLLDIHTYLSSQNLINMDKCSMRQSVEVRVPLLYRPLVAIGLCTPDGQLVRGLHNKVPIRQTGHECLPACVLKGPKLGFAPPMLPVVMSEEVRDLLTGPRTTARGLYRTSALKNFVSSLRSHDEHAAEQLFGLAIVEQWFRCFMDGDPIKGRHEVSS